jgi:hypothetical protein
MSVNNHALRLAEVGRRAEALTMSQEAVNLRRELGNWIGVPTCPIWLGR